MGVRACELKSAEVAGGGEGRAISVDAGSGSTRSIDAPRDGREARRAVSSPSEMRKGTAALHVD